MMGMFIRRRYKHKDIHIILNTNTSKSIQVNFILWLNNEKS